MLVFLDGSLPVQQSNNHRVAHNVFVDNNGPNYANPGAAWPACRTAPGSC